MDNKTLIEAQVILIGTFDKMNYRNEGNGYSLFTIRTNDPCPYRNGYGSVRCAGHIPAYIEGMPLRISGYWEQSNAGMRIHIQSVEEVSDSEAVTIRYLTGICTGIGDATARKIVKETGADIFSFIQRQDAEEILRRCVSNIDAAALIRSVRNSVEQREVFEFILRYGGTYPDAMHICSEYGMNSMNELKADPYKVGLKNGLTFLQCDNIAKDQARDVLDKSRINALISDAINMIEKSGHTYTTLEGLMNTINFYIKKSVYQDEVPATIIANAVARHPGLILEMGNPIRIFSKDLWNAEQDIVQSVKRITNGEGAMAFHEDIIAEIETEEGVHYSEDQKNSFTILKSTGIKILTGGPGTGKTTTIKGLIEGFRKIKPYGSIALCAPTGRAAQHMSETTGMEASTIHKLIDFKPYGSDFCFKDQTDPIQADFIIVDEVSMVDTKLMAMLLDATKSGTLLLLVGDKDQLPSVGPGNILHDFLSSGKIDTYMLTKNHRQKGGSFITQNADIINSGSSKLIEGTDFRIYRVSNAKEAKQKASEIVKTHYKKQDPYFVQILTSTKMTEAGTVSLNEILQKELNQEKTRIDYGNFSYRLHDKVMMLNNNYEKGYFNGDIGTVIRINGSDMTIDIGSTLIELDRFLFQDITLCYSATIHKSQGSEYPVVIGILPDHPTVMLKKNLLYTLVTRAKQLIELIVVGNALEISVKNSGNEDRNTRLMQKLISPYSELIPMLKNKVTI